MESVESVDDPLTNSNRYVLADISSFFTLLVGIYFPSVTGVCVCVCVCGCVRERERERESQKPEKVTFSINI